jgi:hypothetical protein
MKKQNLLKLIVLFAMFLILALTTGCAGYRGSMPIVPGKNFDMSRIHEYEVVELEKLQKNSSWSLAVEIPWWPTKKRVHGEFEQLAEERLKGNPNGVALVDVTYRVSAICLPVLVKMGYFSIQSNKMLVDPKPSEIETENRKSGFRFHRHFGKRVKERDKSDEE